MLLPLLILCCGQSWAQSTTLGSAGNNAGNSAEVEYSAGLSAYLDGDYKKAQSHWFQAARASHAKAMFNLGLLHQQQKISGADVAKAERWFRLAGQNGYAAADFHLATWLQQRKAPDSEVRTYLTRAAQNGFLPARSKLQGMGGGQGSGSLPPPISDAGLQNGNGESRAEPEQLRLSFQGAAWIRQQNNRHWTIQILAFEEQAKVEEFIDQHRLHQRAAYFVERTSAGVLYKLIYGSYASKEAADRAREALKPALQQHGPWLRSLASVQAVLN